MLLTASPRIGWFPCRCMFRRGSLFTDCPQKVCVWNNRFQSIPRPRPHARVTECACLGQNNSWIENHRRGPYRASSCWNLKSGTNRSYFYRSQTLTQRGPRSNSQFWKVFSQKMLNERRKYNCVKDKTFHSQLKRSTNGSWLFLSINQTLFLTLHELSLPRSLPRQYFIVTQIIQLSWSQYQVAWVAQAKSDQTRRDPGVVTVNFSRPLCTDRDQWPASAASDVWRRGQCLGLRMGTQTHITVIITDHNSWACVTAASPQPPCLGHHSTRGTGGCLDLRTAAKYAGPRCTLCLPPRLMVSAWRIGFESAAWIINVQENVQNNYLTAGFREKHFQK